MSGEAVETDLLDAIAAEPDAVEPRLIYADYLQARSDPRGELIVVQAGRLAKPDDVQLEQREKELVTQLTAQLLEQIAPDLLPELIVRWHLGFIDAVQLRPRTIRLLRGPHRDWFAQPVFAAVREVDIRSKYARNLRFIHSAGLDRTLQRLGFGDGILSLDEPTLQAIPARVPKLGALHLRCGGVPELRPLHALPLRDLSFEIRSLDGDDLDRVIAMPWQLETLRLRTTLSVDDDLVPMLGPLFDGSVLASVKHFVLAGGVPIVPALETMATSKRAATVDKITGDFQRAAYHQLLRLEQHRPALAKVTFAPVLGAGDYTDVENLVATGSVLNYRLDRPAEALPLYEQALRLRPEHSSARHNLGVALRKLKRLDESLVAFDTLIGQSKNPTASMYNGRHYTLCELGRRDEARIDLERAVKLEPNHADAWNNLGVERQYIGDVEGAFAAFARCMEIDGEHGYARRNEADLYLELGRAGEALPIYELLLTRKPGDPSLLAMIAHCQLETGDMTAARATLDGRFADRGNEPHPRLYTLRALALRELGELPKAREDLAQVATTTDCPAWYAITLYVRSFDERALWRQVVPDSAVGPQEISDAVIAHAKSARPATATAMHDASVDDQLDCAELAIGAALLAGDRPLAVRRARAAAALHAEQGPRYFRKWFQTLSTIMVLSSRDLHVDARELLWLVLRAVRGRKPTADVMAVAE